MSLTALEKRLSELEAASHQHEIQLPDGSYLRTDGLLEMMRIAIKIKRDTGREPTAADFSPEEWTRWHKFAVLPNPERYGGIVAMTSEVAMRLCK